VFYRLDSDSSHTTGTEMRMLTGDKGYSKVWCNEADLTPGSGCRRAFEGCGVGRSLLPHQGESGEEIFFRYLVPK